jgi:4-hydroxy-tetrahydrodipicolinate reductase
VIRVGVVGAAGRMGRLVCDAITADPDLALVAAVSPSHAGQQVGAVTVAAGMDALSAANADVAVEFTTPDAVMANVRWLIEHGIHSVVGTTGIGPPDLEEIRGLVSRRRAPNALVAPNFAVGAVLMQRFAEAAAPFYPAVEIVELHHEGKLDAPSGTAVATARRIGAAGSAGARQAPSSETIDGVRGGDVGGVRVHSIRLPGLVAHQEVIFGGEGETLSIRHDSTNRISFMPGVVLAVKAVGSQPGLTVGLEPLLGLG